VEFVSGLGFEEVLPDIRNFCH